MNPLILALGLVALGGFGYRRYHAPKPGDRLLVRDFAAPGADAEVTVASLNPDGEHLDVDFQPPGAGVPALIRTQIARSTVVRNLTPRLL